MQTMSVFLFTVVFFSAAQGQVVPPMTNFTLEQFDPAMPSNSAKNAIEQISGGESTSFGRLEDSEIFKLPVRYQAYFFSLFIQVENDIVTSFSAKLPSYFLHDVFHQSIINRLGKQQTYMKKDEEAVYIWQTETLQYTYEASCTITCFPVSFSVEMIGQNKPKGSSLREFLL